MGQVHMTGFFPPLQIHLENLADAKYFLVDPGFCESIENEPTFEIPLLFRLLTCFCNFFYYSH